LGRAPGFEAAVQSVELAKNQIRSGVPMGPPIRRLRSMVAATLRFLPTSASRVHPRPHFRTRNQGEKARTQIDIGATSASGRRRGAGVSDIDSGIGLIQPSIY